MHTHPYFRRAAAQFRALGNERRLFILALLQKEPLSGDKLREILHVGPPSITKHLHRLLAGGLIIGKRKGRRVFFSLSANAREQRHFREWIRKGLLH
ncbi:MAG: winged helix-turn-helix transcriptional regulator [Candidatus Kerfeldbacteria bacterium]|nr:winged helix-turn-helix transcriptional regulator [Candidatus Kerfeldbacteria bacterium]